MCSLTKPKTLGYNASKTNQTKRTKSSRKQVLFTSGESAEEKCFQSGFEPEIVAELCIFLFSELKNLGP